MQYLVINNNKNGLYSYADKYRLFDDRRAAITHFCEIGGEEECFGISLSDKVGVATIQKSGLIDVTFLPIQTQA
jgi:hypothetical protein